MSKLNKRSRSSRRGFFIGFFALLFFFAGVFFLWIASLEVPDISAFRERRVTQSTKIYDRTGEVLLYNFNEDKNRTLVTFDEVSQEIKNAVIAVEDPEFYTHHGIKPSAIVRAVLVNLLSLEFSQGGSTITQQVVKNTLLTTEKKISRKLKEWALSLKLEQVLSKEEILSIYLNESPYGGSIYGIAEASEAFFGKPPSEISLVEAAYLAAIPQPPTYYSPYGNHREELEERKNLVLRKMKDLELLSQEELEKALQQKVVFEPPKRRGIVAPHFVFYVQEYLEETYGKRAVDEEGLKVITTLDARLQEKAQNIVYEAALKNEVNFNAENAALVAVNPQTGEILVMVGSRDYFDEDIEGNFNAALGRRQPGSAFKPFVYATAFNKGFTPETVVFDLQTQFSALCPPDDLSKEAPCYTPDNYDDVFRGPVSLREALAQSINVPSVKLLYLTGLQKSLETAKKMGITTLEGTDRYGLTLVLGGGEVTLLDLTSAYGVFANDGVRHPPVAILRVENNKGEVLEEFRESEGLRVLDKNVARTVSDVLSDNAARAPAFGARSALYFPGREVAAKTGTTNDYHDAWIVGYTPTLAVGAWAGNNDNSAMEKRVAGFIIAPLWHSFFEEAIAGHPNEPFPRPLKKEDKTLPPIVRGLWEGGVSYFIDTYTQKLATEHTPEESRQERVIKDVHSILYWIDKDNIRGGKPENPEEDPQFERWERAVRNWVLESGIVEETEEIIPKEVDDVHTPEKAPRLSVSGINDTTELSPFTPLTFSVSSSGTYPLSKVEVFLNNIFLSSQDISPFQFTFSFNDLRGVEENNTLRVVGYDVFLNKGELTLTLPLDREGG